MTSQSDKSRADGKKAKEKRRKKEHLNHLLDEGLEETFPASDPPAVVAPGHEIPTEAPGGKEK